MRLASYNVENLFERAAAMNLPSWSDGRKILEDHAKFNGLIAKPSYSTADKAAMLAILAKYPPLLSKPDSEFLVLRENRGRLRKMKAGSTAAEIVADGRGDWVGWMDLVRAPVNAAAIANTARLISELEADVVGVVEAEDRPGLKRFNELVIGSTEVGGAPFDHVMLVDGNDDRGIDVGILARTDHTISLIRSHADDRDAQGRTIFSRDCACYLVRTPAGSSVWVLVNHLKSKGYGSQSSSDKRRLAQATRLRAIYDELVAGNELVAVIGDMNDTPDSAPLAPLTAPGSPLRDVSAHAAFDDGGRPGTYANGTKGQKIDYILCSPALFATVERGGIDRRGVWGGKYGTLFPHLPTITSPIEAASDHAAIWADFDV